MIEVNQNTKENMVLTRVDLATATGQNTLPDGFPKEIPVETANITDGHKVVFPDRGVTGRGITEYTIEFISSKSKGEVYDMYEAFMPASGYRFGEGNRSKEKGILYGRSNSGDLSIVISEKDGKTNVHLTVLKQN